MLGVPLGLMLADRAGWRAALLMVTALGALALAGLALMLPEVRGATLPGLRARAAQLRDGRVGAAVLVTFLQTVASLGLYTYLVPVLHGIGTGPSGPALWLWGLGGIAGSAGIGPLLDRVGRPGATAGVLLLVLTVALALLPAVGGPGALPLIALWGMAGWAFVVPQQHRLLDLGPTGGAAALALNSSATYLGGSVGAALGGAALAAGLAPRALPLCAAASAALAVAAQLAAVRRTEPSGRASAVEEAPIGGSS